MKDRFRTNIIVMTVNNMTALLCFAVALACSPAARASIWPLCFCFKSVIRNNYARSLALSLLVPSFLVINATYHVLCLLRLRLHRIDPSNMAYGCLC